MRMTGLLCCMLLTAQTHGGERIKDHPLIPVIEMASSRYHETAEDLKDYSCTLVKRERIDGKLRNREYIHVLLRHEQIRDGRVEKPFGVYLRYLAPAELKGREVIYVEGRNQGKLIARRGGLRLGYFTTAIAPDSDLAMKRNLYPITEIGIRNLIRKLLEVAREELQYDECEVEYFVDAMINRRPCTVIQITHPVRREHFRYHVARIFIDDELQVPIRFASYDWPEEEGGPPQLLEEYTYLDLRANIQLTDWDFDVQNPGYAFGEISSR